MNTRIKEDCSKGSAILHYLVHCLWETWQQWKTARQLRQLYWPLERMQPERRLEGIRFNSMGIRGVRTDRIKLSRYLRFVIMSHRTAVHCITSYYMASNHDTKLYSTPLYHTTTSLHYTTLHYTTLHSTPLHSTTSHYTTLHYTTSPLLIQLAPSEPQEQQIPLGMHTEQPPLERQHIRHPKREIEEAKRPLGCEGVRHGWAALESGSVEWKEGGFWKGGVWDDVDWLYKKQR